MIKYIFITGYNNKINKSIFIAFLISLLEENNLKITIKKISEFKSFKTFITNNGLELDFEMGYYERYCNIIINEINNILTTNTDKMVEFIKSDSDKYDIVFIDMDNIYYNVIKYFKKEYINIHFISSKTPKSFFIKSDIIIKEKDCDKLYNNLYKIPYILYNSYLYNTILKLYNITQSLTKWENIYNKIDIYIKMINIFIIIKFTKSYISLYDSLNHAAYFLKIKLNIYFINPKKITKEELKYILNKYKGGIIVPGGMGDIGFKNKIEAIRIARENNIPLLGICYGMQIMCIEFAKNVLNITKACTQEIDSLKNYIHIVHSIEPNEENIKKRLGNFDVKIKKDSLAYDICKTNIVNERHRHKYKINKEYINEFECYGLKITGMSLDNVYVEIVEYPKNDFFIGIQYHPELKSTIFKPHPIFIRYLESLI